MEQDDNQRWKTFPAPVRDVFEGLWQEVVSLHAHWELYQDLFTNSDDIELINATVPTVFQLIEENLRASMTVAFGRLTDPSATGKKLNLCLTRLVETIEPHCDSAFFQRTQSILEKIKTECIPITDVRNRSVAHNDLATSLNYKENPLPGIGRKHISNALTLISDLMNMIQLRFENGETGYSHVIQRGTGKDLLFYLRQAAEHDRKSVK
jgi:hypothetical protein